MEKEQIISILDKLDFFQGQRAGRELWNNKPFEVQEQDISDFSRDVALIKEYIKSQDEQIFQLENRLKECENGYAGTLHLESNKLHDAEERVKELTEENEKFKQTCDDCAGCTQWKCDCANIQYYTVREIFTEIYSSLDYIEEQMDPDEIPECFFSVREDIDSLKEKFEGEVNADG